MFEKSSNTLWDKCHILTKTKRYCSTIIYNLFSFLKSSLSINRKVLAMLLKNIVKHQKKKSLQLPCI